MTTHGEFNWHELQTQDPEAAMRFYGNTIGWTFEREQMPSGGVYWIAMAAGKPVGGILTRDANASQPAADRWMTYLHVDGLDRAIERARDQGAEILRAPWEVPGVGRVVMLREPGGAEVGWVTPLEQTNG